jgi:hypothetical protein
MDAMFMQHGVGMENGSEGSEMMSSTIYAFPRMVMPVKPFMPTPTNHNLKLISSPAQDSVTPSVMKMKETLDPMLRYKMVVEEVHTVNPPLMDSCKPHTERSTSVKTAAVAYVPAALVPVRDESVHRITLITRYLENGLIRNRNTLVAMQDLVRKISEARENYPNLFVLHLSTMVGAPCYTLLNSLIERLIRKRKKLCEKYHAETDFVQRKKLQVFLDLFTLTFKPLVRIKVREIFKKIHHHRFTEAEKEHLKNRFSILTREWKIKGPDGPPSSVNGTN